MPETQLEGLVRGNGAAPTNSPDVIERDRDGPSSFQSGARRGEADGRDAMDAGDQEEN